MDDRTDARRRLDLHHISINFAAASWSLRFHASRHRPGLPATPPAPRRV